MNHDKCKHIKRNITLRCNICKKDTEVGISYLTSSTFHQFFQFLKWLDDKTISVLCPSCKKEG